VNRNAIVMFIFSTTSCFAQQDPQFTQYMFNNLYYNPGFSGVEGISKVQALYRSQWTGYQPTFYEGGAPTSQLVSYSTPILKMNSGFGAYIMNDKLGPQNNLEAQASYAYHWRVKNSKLSVGIRTGLFSQTINSDLYSPIDKDDPSLPRPYSGKWNRTKPDMAAGIFFRNEKFYLGAGVNHLIKLKFDFTDVQRNSLKAHTYISAGYFYEVNFDLRLQFVALVKSDFVKTQFDIGGIAYLKDNMWGGLSFRQSEAAIVMLGYNNLLKDKSMKVGYSMDVIVKGREAKQPLSHELMVSYELPVSLGVGKKTIRTPRYRH